MHCHVTEGGAAASEACYMEGDCDTNTYTYTPRCIEHKYDVFTPSKLCIRDIRD